jgi:hypothetical protein
LGIRRFLPYLAGLLVLAFALGSLPRGTPGGSIFFQSYWLLYIIYLAPFAVLGTMVALIILIGLNWRALGTGIGMGLTGRRTMRKKRSRAYILVQAIFWALAIGILVQKQVTASGSTLSGSVVANIQNDPSPTVNPFLAGGILPAVSNIFGSIWFSVALLGLLIVGGLVLVQSARVAVGSKSMYPELEEKQLEGLKTVYQAMKLVDDTASDPRSRIISCYQHMLGTVSRIGVPVSSDQTARELEKAIRSTFLLKGPATSDLTRLFEEARYSLHEIVDDDAMKAHQDLESIAAELKVQMKDWA